MKENTTQLTRIRTKIIHYDKINKKCNKGSNNRNNNYGNLTPVLHIEVAVHKNGSGPWNSWTPWCIRGCRREWEGCVIWGKRRTPTTCLWQYLFFGCLFHMDADWWCLNCYSACDYELSSLPLVFSAQYVECFLQCWAWRHLILVANLKKLNYISLIKLTSPKQMTLSDSSIVFFNLFVLYIFSYVIWICRFSSQIHSVAVAGDCWYPVSSSSVCSKGGWSLEQILALPGRWTVLCNCTSPWDIDGNGWICMKMEGSGYKQLLFWSKKSPLGYVGISMSKAMASLRRSTAWSSAIQLVEGIDGLKDITTSRWCG